MGNLWAISALVLFLSLSLCAGAQPSSGANLSGYSASVILKFGINPHTVSEGDRAVFNYTIINDGDVPLRNLTIIDTFPGTADVNVELLEPSESMPVKVDYYADKDDFESEVMGIAAAVQGIDPNGYLVGSSAGCGLSYEG